MILDAPSSVKPQTLEDIQTLVQLFTWRVAASPATEAYRWHDGTAWCSISWHDMDERVRRHTAAMASLDLPMGARVAILLPNGLDAVCMDQAALALGLVPVPMHALDNPASIAYILRDSEAGLLVASELAQWQRIVGAGERLSALRQVVVAQPFDAVPPAVTEPAQPLLASLQAWLAHAGDDCGGAAARPAPGPDDLAALVYTSGTTGKPKGVMLTHRNVVSNIQAALRRVAPLPQDVFLSFLPLSHTFERTAGYYLPIAAGCCVAFSRSTALLAEDLKTVRPSILISVPRIYERVYAAVQARLVHAPLQTRLFNWAQQVGWRRFCRAQRLAVPDGTPAWVDALAWPLLDWLVARPFRAQLGGRLRLAVSGGAALAPAIAQCFLGLGLAIAQGYGMTESAPVVSVNGLDDNDPSTVGRPLDGVEVRLGDNQELLVRGPNVMRGYWKRDEDTTAALAGGWLHTGDQAALEQGRIRILGRIKEIIVTSTGEKIAPADLELAILADPLFEQVFAVGENRPYIACIVVLNLAGWQRLAAELGLDPASGESLQAAAARQAVLARVRALTTHFPYYAQPRAVQLTLEPWTVENSLMTPTLKLKRKNLLAHYSAQIDWLYAPRH
jgi:long-chain acyl-CoA synthetase